MKERERGERERGWREGEGGRERWGERGGEREMGRERWGERERRERERGEGGESQSSPTLGKAFSLFDSTLYNTGSRRYLTLLRGNVSPKCLAKRLMHSVLFM